MKLPDLDAPAVTRRRLLRLGLVVPAAPVLAAWPSAPAVAAPRPARPRVHSVRLDGRTLVATGQPTRTTASGRAGQSYATDQLATPSFRIAAFTWDGGPSQATMWIRTRERATGGWSDWHALYDDHHGADPDTAEAIGARRGTNPVVVAESDAVEVRVASLDGTVPSDLRVDLVDLGDSPPATTANPSAPQALAAEVPQPAILTRADWGADESLRVGEPEYGEIRGTFVHHTAGVNAYDEAEVPAIIRGIYSFHVESRGWWDIGYNFLIDKFGRIWEGRYGGITEAVIGAHTLGYNTYAFAAAVLGTYVDKQPEAAVLRAFERLIAWKFARHGVDPNATVAYPEQLTLPAISGHRDGYATECPGELLYARLNTIRGGVQSLLAGPTVASQLSGAAHTLATRAGKQVYFDITWRAGSTGVNGTVELQVKSGNSWVPLRNATVTNGVGTVHAAPTADKTFRLRSVRATSPANVAAVTSGQWTIRAVSSRTNLTMSRGGATKPDGRIPMKISWKVGSTGVTGKVSLQVYKSGRWQHVRYATVKRGKGTTVLKPSGTRIYRLRGVSVTSPSGVDKGHPASTSNEYRAIVSR